MTTTTKAKRGKLFDVTVTTGKSEGTVEKVPLDQLELAPNPRRDIDPDGIRQLAVMLSHNGQMIPCIGRRISPKKVVIYDGQRRKLAAEMSHELAGTDGYEDLAPIQALTVFMLDHRPSAQEIRRIQMQAHARADLSQRDRQDQFADCWQERAGSNEDDRIALVCVDMGISAKEAHNLRRQLTLPDPIRERVDPRPSGGKISITLANRLAEMNQITPQLTSAVADRVTSSELQDQALKDLGAFVTATVRDNEDIYAVRLDAGAALDTADELRRAVKFLPEERLAELTTPLGVEIGEVPKRLADMVVKARKGMVRTIIDQHVRDRAANGGYAWVFKRGEDFADAVWLIEPMFMIDLIAQQMADTDVAEVDEEQPMFATAGDVDAKQEEARQIDAEERKRRREIERDAASRNVGLGADISATLTDPTGDQAAAARDFIVHLIALKMPEVLAYGAGWTDRTRMKPVGDTGRFEPLTVDEIVDAEVERALADSDPMRGTLQILARVGAAFLLDDDGVTKSKDLGRERMARRLRDALPGGDHPINDALWRFMRPMLSPNLVEMHRDRFVTDAADSTVDLETHRADRTGDEVADLLGDDAPDGDAA